MFGGPVTLGHHGHAAATAVQVHFQHGRHALHGTRCVGVVFGDLAAEHWRVQHHHRLQARQQRFGGGIDPVVDAIGLAATHDVAGVLAALWLADQLEIGGCFQCHFGRHRLLHRCGGQFTEVRLLAARAADHTSGHRDARWFHLPLLGRGGHQHGAGAGADFAVLQPRVGGGAGTAGDLHAEHRVGVDRSGRRQHTAHLGPVGVHLVGYQHRQRGGRALAEVEPVDLHGDGAVGGDGHKRAGCLRWFGGGCGISSLAVGGRHGGQRKHARPCEGDELAALQAGRCVGCSGDLGAAGKGFKAHGGSLWFKPATQRRRGGPRAGAGRCRSGRCCRPWRCRYRRQWACAFSSTTPWRS